MEINIYDEPKIRDNFDKGKLIGRAELIVLKFQCLAESQLLYYLDAIPPWSDNSFINENCISDGYLG